MYLCLPRASAYTSFLCLPRVYVYLVYLCLPHLSVFKFLSVFPPCICVYPIYLCLSVFTPFICLSFYQSSAMYGWLGDVIKTKKTWVIYEWVFPSFSFCVNINWVWEKINKHCSNGDINVRGEKLRKNYFKTYHGNSVDHIVMWWRRSWKCNVKGGNLSHAGSWS